MAEKRDSQDPELTASRAKEFSFRASQSSTKNKIKSAV